MGKKKKESLVGWTHKGWQMKFGCCGEVEVDSIFQEEKGLQIFDDDEGVEVRITVEELLKAERVIEKKLTIQEIRGAVARGWCHDANRSKEMDSELAEAIAKEVYRLCVIEEL